VTKNNCRERDPIMTTNYCPVSHNGRNYFDLKFIVQN
jgi:hypothetical protein